MICDLSSHAEPVLRDEFEPKAEPLEFMFASVPESVQTNEDFNMTIFHFQEPSIEVLAVAQENLSEPSVMASCLLISSGVG